MTAVPYQRILERTCDRVGISRDNIFTGDQKALRSFHSDRLEEGWRQWWWPDLMRTGERFFRQSFSTGTTYAALDEVYYPATETYYSALQATTGNLPTDLTYWAPVTNAGAAAFDATLVHVKTDRVRYLGTVYQMHTASGVAGTLPSDTTYWGPTQPWIQSISKTQSWQTNEIGTVRDVWQAHPEVTTRATQAAWHENADGIIVETPATSVYLRFRLPAPQLFGAVFDSTATYAVDDQVYFSSADIPGNFYNCIVATSAGQSPDTTASSWEVISIPDYLAGWIEKAAASDWELSRHQLAVAGIHLRSAHEELFDQQSKYTAAQGERGRTAVP